MCWVALDRAIALADEIGAADRVAGWQWMAIVGFLPATDPRVLATIDAIEKRLTDKRGLVYRYDTRGEVDGLQGREGTFLLCTFWLAVAPEHRVLKPDCRDFGVLGRLTLGDLF